MGTDRGSKASKYTADADLQVNIRTCRVIRGSFLWIFPCYIPAPPRHRALALPQNHVAAPVRTSISPHQAGAGGGLRPARESTDD